MKRKKLLSIILIFVLAAAVIGSVVYFMFFVNDSKTDEYDILRQLPNKEYTVTIKTEGNMLLPDIDVFVYFDSSFEKLIDYAKTNKDGQVTFDLAEYDDYAIVFSGIPNGYSVEECYRFQGDNTEITFSSHLIEGEDIRDGRFIIGSVMFDATFTTNDNATSNVADALSQNKMLLINFWHIDSPSSVEQLKMLNGLYEKYKGNVEIIALNPVDSDEQITAFKNENAIAFPMASCSRRVSGGFGVTRAPASVVVDRYGIISLIEVGTVSSEAQLTTVFDHFVNENYVQQLFRTGVTEFISQLWPAPSVLEIVVKDDEGKKIPGVELKMTVDGTDIPAVTDENGVATFNMTVKPDDVLTVVSYPEGYENKGKTEIVFTDVLFTYSITLTKSE